MTEPENARRGDSPHPAEGYDALAERAAELDRETSPWGDSHFQAYYSWPATRDLLPDVADRRVLIAGCGRGDHVGWFLDRGATVVGLDASEAALRTARDRFGDDAAFRRADLTDPLDFAADSFDLAVSHLVLGHVEEWRPVFEELRRVLTDRGLLVFGVVHPDYLRRKEAVTNYYETQRIVVSWPGDTQIPTYYRPTNAVVEPLVDAGFGLERFDEPTPDDAFAAVEPERYEAAIESPQVLCVRARVRS